MRRFMLAISPLGPLALLTTGCDMRAYTPSELVPVYQPNPTMKVVQVPARDEAIARWQLPPTNTWAPYAKLTLLSSLDAAAGAGELPDIETLDAVHSARAAADSVAIAGLPRDAMWIVDLRGAASVAFGATLTRTAREPIVAVPTFNNWPAEDELVPAEETLAAMVAMSPRIPAPDDPPSLPLFLLDAWRLAYKDESVDEGTTDNRYMLSPVDFPSVETLRASGITRVIYVVEALSDEVREEDDLNALFVAYEQAGIQISLVDLGWLTGPPPEGVRAWHENLGSCIFRVEPRFTVVEDPRFYARAHGGFGGVHGFGNGGGVHFGGGSYGGHGGHGGSYGGGFGG